MTTKLETTREDVAHLLETFADYINPAGYNDPWFTLAEINQQFAWENVPETTLLVWLSELVDAGRVTRKGDRRHIKGPEWRWVH